MKPRHIVVKIVKSNEALLKSFKTHKELYKFAVEKGLTNSALEFFYFKDALFEIGINYYRLEEDTLNEMESILEEKNEVLRKKINKKIVLYSSASFTDKSFAICDIYFDPVWFGTFFKDPKNYSNACLDSAQKAIYAACEFKKQNEIEAIELKLIVDAQWLHTNYIYKKMSIVLSQQAIKNNIVLDLQSTYASNNPANKYILKLKEGQKNYMKLNISCISLFKT